MRLNSHSFTFAPYLLFTLIITMCYVNSFYVPWVLDDPPNIINNPPIRIDNILPETLFKTFFAKPFSDGIFYRPISNLSFALNWFFSTDKPFSYHIINLIIHICSTFFLFRSTLLLLRAAPLPLSIGKNSYNIALLTSILWAINPIQTQAVTYIVQRMASLAGMFYIISMYYYIRWRVSGTRREQGQHILFSLFFFILSTGCKENTVTLIPSLLILEYFFLYSKKNNFSKIAIKILTTATICLLLSGIYFIIDHHLFEYINKNIGSRPFSIGERLLTQPSILLFYLTLIFFPSPTRLSIDHSFPLSTSLWHPWTTLPAILIILGLIILALVKSRKYPFFSFAILFFFINHLVESTIIPLEMIFEHRNYIPSMFLFLPVAATLSSSLEKTRQSSRLIHTVLITCIPVILITSGLGTYTRNKAWKTEESLWTDALKKAASNARPYAKLGEIYGWQKEKTNHNLHTAIALLEKATHLESPRTSFKAALIDNIGKVYFNYGLLDQAVNSYHRSIDINPNFITSRFDLASSLTIQGKFDKALEQINTVIDKNNLQSRFFNLKANLLLWLNHPNRAAESMSHAMHRTMVNKERYFYNSGVALTRAGHNSQGLWFLKQALKQFPDNPRILYSLIENRLLANNFEQAKEYAVLLIERHNLPKIKTDFEQLPLDYSSVPVNVTLIKPIILDAFQASFLDMQ